MIFPIYGKIKHGNQTTNQLIIFHDSEKSKVPLIDEPSGTGWNMLEPVYPWKAQLAETACIFNPMKESSFEPLPIRFHHTGVGCRSWSVSGSEVIAPFSIANPDGLHIIHPATDLRLRILWSNKGFCASCAVTVLGIFGARPSSPANPLQEIETYAHLSERSREVSWNHFVYFILYILYLLPTITG